MVKGRYLFRHGRRLPTYLPNLDLSLMPLSPADTLQVIKTGWIKQAVFRTIPSVNKIEIKNFLESVYGMQVEKVNTVNVEGRKKRSKNGWTKTPDWKKAFVTFLPPKTPPPSSDQTPVPPTTSPSQNN